MIQYMIINEPSLKSEANLEEICKKVNELLYMMNWIKVLVMYCEQAESIRETCSGDPAYYEMNI